jgi:hypothetical protein
MSALIPYLTLKQPLEEVLAWTTQQLNERGLQVEQTFDLQVARLSHSGCPCPHHGTDSCSCQMIVLLVHGKRSNPQTLILHGNEGQTNLSTINLTGKRSNLALDEKIRSALFPQDVEIV